MSDRRKKKAAKGRKKNGKSRDASRKERGSATKGASSTPQVEPVTSHDGSTVDDVFGPLSLRTNQNRAAVHRLLARQFRISGNVEGPGIYHNDSYASAIDGSGVGRGDIDVATLTDDQLVRLRGLAARQLLLATKALCHLGRAIELEPDNKTARVMMQRVLEEYADANLAAMSLTVEFGARDKSKAADER